MIRPNYTFRKLAFMVSLKEIDELSAKISNGEAPFIVHQFPKAENVTADEFDTIQSFLLTLSAVQRCNFYRCEIVDLDYYQQEGKPKISQPLFFILHTTPNAGDEKRIGRRILCAACQHEGQFVKTVLAMECNCGNCTPNSGKPDQDYIGNWRINQNALANLHLALGITEAADPPEIPALVA